LQLKIKQTGTTRRASYVRQDQKSYTINIALKKYFGPFSGEKVKKNEKFSEFFV